MAERYAKARMLQQSEARDARLRDLFAVLPTREDVAWAIVLYHRLIPRLDIQGAILFEPAYLMAECFMGYNVQLSDVERWCQALLDVRLVESYTVDGLQYAWTRTFYKNQPGLDLSKEEPRYPPPPDFNFNELIATGRPGPKPKPPGWVIGAVVRGQVDLEGGEYLAEISAIEDAFGEELALQVREYALLFVDELQRPRRMIGTARYYAVLKTLAQWRSQGAVTHRNRKLPWNDRKMMAALRETATAVIDGHFRSHEWLVRVYARSDEQPEPDEAAAEQRKLAAARKEELENAMTAWGQRTDARVAKLTSAEYDRIDEAARVEVDRDFPVALKKGRMYAQLVAARVRLIVANEAGDPAPTPIGGTHESIDRPQHSSGRLERIGESGTLGSFAAPHTQHYEN